jgi:hypothetical protein
VTRTEGAAIARKKRAASAPSLHDRFWSKVRRGSDSECWLWLASFRRNDEGYGAFWLDGRHQPASRVAWVLTHGPILIPDIVVCHHCDIPGCCNPSHLFLGTRLDNDADRINKGRQCRGSQQNNAVLTEDLVSRIREMASAAGYAATAKSFGLKYHTVWDACNRRWRHV